MMASGCGYGCFCCRAVGVESLMLAMVSSEHVRQTATLKFPSSNLAATRAAKDSSGSHSKERGHCLRHGGVVDDGGSTSSPICLFTSEAKFQRRPPLL